MEFGNVQGNVLAAENVVMAIPSLKNSIEWSWRMRKEKERM
jgi:hypothetical protein